MPQSLTPDVKAAFNMGREESAQRWRDWAPITDVMESNNLTEEMVAHGAKETFRKWNDERQAKSFREYEYNIKNYPWERTVAIDRRLIRFDKTGQILSRAKAGGVAFEKFLSEQIWCTFRSGSSLVAYDGQYYFDTDHDWSGTDQSNYESGNSPLAATNLDVAMETMTNYKDEHGKNLGVMPDLLVAGPENKREAYELTESEYTTESTSFKTNYFSGVGLGMLVTPWISGNSTANEWYLVDTTLANGKPVKHTQVTPNPEMSSQEDESYTGFNRNEWQYGFYYDGGFGVGDWYAAYKNGIADPALADTIDPTDYYSG